MTKVHRFVEQVRADKAWLRRGVHECTCDECIVREAKRRHRVAWTRVGLVWALCVFAGVGGWLLWGVL